MAHKQWAERDLSNKGKINQKTRIEHWQIRPVNLSILDKKKKKYVSFSCTVHIQINQERDQNTVADNSRYYWGGKNPNVRDKITL